MSVSVTFAGCGDSFGSGLRFNTCFLVDAPGIRFCIDFGASSLIALGRLGIPHNTIDTMHEHFDADRRPQRGRLSAPRAP
jgi:hypothetical protein